MPGHYDHYKDLCDCSASSNTVGNGSGGVYDFMDEICVCGPGIVLLCMRDLEGNETTSYPVNVYNVNEEYIGLATTKSQYRIIWNSDPANQAVGTLDNGVGPFCFSLSLNAGQPSPGWVIGDPINGGVVIDEGIYEPAYGTAYE